MHFALALISAPVVGDEFGVRSLAQVALQQCSGGEAHYGHYDGRRWVL